MTSFANYILLSYPSIPSYPVSSLQLRSLSFRNFRNPAAPYRSIPKGAGALKTTREGAWEKKIEDPLPFQLNTHDLDEDKQEERIVNLVREIKEIFLSLGDGDITPSAYDTAWLARIPSMDDPKKPHFPTTLEWIMKNQLEDDSWGDPWFFFLYARLVCTLSCVLTLTQWRQGDEQIAKGLRFLQTHIQDLDNEKNTVRRTVGFEMIFPSMLNEAKSHGLNLPYDLPCMKRIIMLREEKKRRIPMEVLNSAPTPLLFSIEGMQELVQWDKILKLQSANGSISDSPSATAATYLKTHDSKCLKYLTYIVKRFEDHDVLEYFKDDDDSFLCMMGETHKAISDFFNLYRFSQIAFLGEKTLKQTNFFTEQYLMNNIKNNQVYDKWAIKKALHKEIVWALRNPWKMSPPRLEVQQYIHNYGENDVWICNTIYRWKPTLVQVLPTKMKQVFIGVCDIMNELTTEAMNAQFGKDVFPYLHDIRKEQLQQYLNIREVKDTKQFDNFEEYADRVKRGLTVAIRLVLAMFLMGDVLSDNALKNLDHRSKIHEHLVSYIALLNLVTEERAAVYLYMK